jgi:nucleoside-diphosphate-sugar epimerase
MKIGVLGASGVVGRALVSMLQQRGDIVRAIVPRAHTETIARETVVADILKPWTIPAAVEDLDILINLSVGGAPGNRCRGHADISRVWSQGTRHLVDTLGAVNRRCRLVQQSTALLHQGSRPSHEGGELRGEGVFTSAIVMEATIQSSDLDWVVIRGAAIYGPGTSRDVSFFQRIAEGRICPPKQSARWITFVHISDLAAAFEHACSLPGGCAFIAADDRPLTYRAMFDGLFLRRSHAGNVPELPALPSFRVEAHRLEASGWRARWPSIFDGVRASVRLTTEAGGFAA